MKISAGKIRKVSSSRPRKKSSSKKPKKPATTAKKKETTKKKIGKKAQTGRKKASPRTVKGASRGKAALRAAVERLKRKSQLKKEDSSVRTGKRKAVSEPRTESKPKPLPRSAARFKVGDYVVYPFHGVGKVRSLEKRDVMGEKVWYYTLDFRDGELTVYIPINQQDERGMRPIVKKKEIPKIINELKKRPSAEESDWKVRYNQYLEKLKSGDMLETAKVARNLRKRGPEGELSMSEKRLLEASMQLIVHEIATVTGRPVDDVEEEITQILKGRRK